jgi:hypothetical protein
MLHFLPSKTEDSSDEVVDWPIIPEIDAVLKRAQTLAPQLGYATLSKTNKARQRRMGGGEEARLRYRRAAGGSTRCARND